MVHTICIIDTMYPESLLKEYKIFSLHVLSEAEFVLVYCHVILNLFSGRKIRYNFPLNSLFLFCFREAAEVQVERKLEKSLEDMRAISVLSWG